MKYIKTTLLTTMLLCSMCMGSMAQAIINQANSGQFNIRIWNNQNSLGSNIYAICQTQDGFIRLGNESGITRFDGVNALFLNRQNSIDIAEDFCRVLFSSNDGVLSIFL